jgi:hypothetical protein
MVAAVVTPAFGGVALTESGEEFNENARESIDNRLAAALWAWSRDPASATDRQHIASLDVASLVEWFLCEAFRHSPDGFQREWWSDGIVTLSLTQLSATSFLAVGATIWADSNVDLQYLAPFEIEFFFAAQNDVEFQRTIVRFGSTDREGAIVRLPWDSCAPALIESRPRRNADWAMAIELTSLQDA